MYVALAFGFLSYVDTMNLKKDVDESTSIYTIPHDGDPATNTITISLNASDFIDNDNDELAYVWSTSDSSLKLEYPDDVTPETNTTTSFTVGAGTYSVELMVTDSYDASNSMKKIFTVGPEKNTVPDLGVVEFSVVEAEDVE